MLKRSMWMAVSIVAVVALGLGGVWAYGQAAKPALAQTPEPNSGYKANQTITVVGQGSARLQPDIAQTSIGVDTMAGTVTEAVKENGDKMKAILAGLKAQGIADKDIQTVNYSISIDFNPTPLPKVEGSTTEPAKPQYRVSNMVTVKIRDLAKIGDVIDAVVEAGANSIWGVNFSVDDPKVAQADARTKAMADALARASALAELGQVKLGPIMSISETVGGGMPVSVMAERAMGGGGDVSVSPGQVEVSYQVQVSYYIQP